MIRETRFLPTKGREGVLLKKLQVKSSLPPFLIPSATSAMLPR